MNIAPRSAANPTVFSPDTGTAPSPLVRRSLAAASIAGVLAATAPPSDAAVIYSVNGVNVGTSLTGSFTTSTLYVGFGTGTFTTSPSSIVGGILIGSSVAASYTTNVVLANTNATKSNIAVASATTTFTGTGFAALTSNWGTINNGGGQTLTNTYTFSPGAAGTVRSIAAQLKTAIIGNETGSKITDTTDIVLISNWVAPVQSTTMTVSKVTGSSSAVTASTASSAAGVVYVLPGQSATATVTVNNIGDGNMAADATTITKGYGNLAGSTSSSVSATGAGGFSLASSSAAFSLNDANAANIPPTGSITPVTSTTYTYTYAGAAARGSSASATLSVQFTNGNSNNTNASQTGTYSVVGQTVAPQNAITAPAFAPVRVGSGATSTASLVIANVGDGNKAGSGTAFNLNGSTGSATPNPPFAGTGSSFSLQDGQSTSYAFTFKAQNTRGTSTGQVTTTLTNGNKNGTNTGETVVTALSGQTVGPVYQANIGVGGPVIANNATIDFVSNGGPPTQYQNLLISNITTDIASIQTLTDLSLTVTLINDPMNEYSFSLDGGAYGVGPISKVVSAANFSSYVANLSIQFNNLIGGPGTAQLRIATDENAAYGATGAIYIYNLRAVPEPGTMMVVGTGLLGLAISRRNRRGRAEAVRLTRRDEEIGA